MLNQKGFSSLTVFIAVALVLGGFYLGRTSIDEIIISPFISTILQIAPSPGSSPTPASDYTDKIVASGDFQFSDHKIKYTFIMPKTGGSVTGFLEGVCRGIPSGIYDGQNSVKGEFIAKCSAGPLNLVNVDLKINYTGTVYLTEGKIEIIWESTSPAEQRGSFNLFFKPSKPISILLPTSSTTPSNNTTDPNTPTSIKVTSPNGGESFKVGDSVHITWSSNNLNKNGSCIVTLAYDNGAKSSAWVPVNTPNGFFDWKLTSESGGHQVKVDMDCYDSNQNNAHDQSDNFFTVAN